MKLYSYQKELVNSKSDRILVNWCRGAGKDTGVAEYILANRPASVLLDTIVYMSVVEVLKNYSNPHCGIEVEETSKGHVNILYKDYGFITIIDQLPMSRDIASREYELFVFEGRRPFTEEKIGGTFNKVINVMTDNINGLYFTREKDSYENIVVDYKDAIKEEAISLESVINSALYGKPETFLKEYAIKDKRKETEMSFNMFKDQAVQRLQKQFLDTNDSKDTVLTRKNIIEMIKDLKQIN